MTRELIYLGGAWQPAAWRTDTSVRRIFNSLADPSTFPELVLAAQDQWCQIAPPVAPPQGYSPRVLPPYGTYTPDDTNTGIVSDPSQLTRLNYPGTADLILTTPGQTFTSMEVFGTVRVQAAGITFQDCLFRGPRDWPTDDGATINCNDDKCTGLLVQDSTYAPQLPNYYRDFMIGHGYTALRNRSIWANDHYGVFTRVGKAYAIDVTIAGCYMTDNVYWQGTTAQYPGQAVGTFNVTTTWGDSYTKPGYPLKADGTHNDGIQVQGGLGPAGSCHLIGNTIRIWDADPNRPHPLGWDDPIPQLGTQNNQKRRNYNTGTNLTPLLDGKYSSNGQCLIIQQNTNQFPHVDTVIAENNWLNDGGYFVNLQALAGGFTTMQCTVRNNQCGENIYDFNNTGNPAIYGIRIDNRAGATISGLSTNTWYEGHWGAIGAPLTEGRATGIVYDS